MKLDFLILSATEFEVSHFLNLFPTHTQITTKSGLKVLSGALNDKKYDLIITGPGVFNASHALTVYLQKLTPSLIIQTGIAGIFEQSGLTTGDLSIATQSHYIHIGIRKGSIEKDPLPFSLVKGDRLTRQGGYTFDPDTVEKHYIQLSTKIQKSEARVNKGLIITVSCITPTKVHADELYKIYSPVMEAMEGTASAHVASLYDIPMIEIRSASNFVGERDKLKWEFDLAVKHLALGLSCLSV